MDEFVRRWFQFYNQVYLYHWQTVSYARHMAYSGVLEDLGVLIDNFVEAYQGKYTRVSVGVSSIEVGDISLGNEEAFVTNYRDFLDNDVRSIAEEGDNDLTAMIDEMVAALNKLLYLQTLG